MPEIVDLRDGLERMGLAGQRIALHASFRSLEGTAGAPVALVDALTRTARTVLVPTFSWAHSVRYADADPIERNAAESPTPDQSDHAAVPPYDPLTSAVDRDMGIVAGTVATWPGAVRSAHPLASWAAWGADAANVVSDHRWDDPFLPIKRLADLDGVVVLLGVTLTACTAIHLAEEMSGRRSFIRWSPDRTGAIRRARVGGCSDGFDRLLPGLCHLFRETRLGPSRVLIAPLQPLLREAATLLSADPRMTMCERGCDRCLAAAAGGPAE